jgi:hypothetical protein
MSRVVFSCELERAGLCAGIPGGRAMDGRHKESVKELHNPSAEANFSGTCAYRRDCGKKND